MSTGNVTQDVTDRDERSGDDPPRLSRPYLTRAPGGSRAPAGSSRSAVRPYSDELCADDPWAGIARPLEAAQKGRA
jgi:hypothetical protein